MNVWDRLRAWRFYRSHVSAARQLGLSFIDLTYHVECASAAFRALHAAWPRDEHGNPIRLEEP